VVDANNQDCVRGVIDADQDPTVPATRAAKSGQVRAQGFAQPCRCRGPWHGDELHDSSRNLGRQVMQGSPRLPGQRDFVRVGPGLAARRSRSRFGALWLSGCFFSMSFAI
jgi:hypothetical protein